MQPTSANIVTSSGLSQREFVDIKIRTKKRNRRTRNVGQDGEHERGRFERSCNPCTCVFFLKRLLITNQMIVMSTMMF